MLEWSKVTWYSKTFAILLFVLLVCGAFFFGNWYQRQISQLSTNNLISTSAISTTTENPGVDIVSQYERSGFKVVATVPNQFYYKATFPPPTPYNALYVVTKRGTGNDDGCGGKYDSDLCYFFLEADYANVPPITYLGKWGPDGSSAGPDSFHFVDKSTVEFSTSFVDGGLKVNEVWRLDLNTASTTMISHQESNG